jgi:hypothetical protein
MADLRDESYWDAVDDEIRVTADRVLTESGPLALDELVRRLESEGVLSALIEDGYDGEALPDLVDDILAQTDGFLHGDDLVGSAETLLEGLTLTHRVSQRELDAGMLDHVPDLGIIDWNRPDGVVLAGGGVAVVDYPPMDSTEATPVDANGSMIGPQGWLDGFADGDLVALRRLDGVVSIERSDELDAASDAVPPVVAALAAAFDRQTGGDDTIGAEPEWMLQEVLLRDPSLFRTPLPPLSDLLAAIGIERRGGWVGRAGAEWSPPGVRRREAEEAALFERYEFDACCTAAFQEVRSGWSTFVRGEPDAEIDAPGLARALAHDAVAAAFVEDLLDRFPDGADRLERYAAALVEGAVGTVAGAAHYLQAMNAEAQGRAIDAEVHLEVALRADPTSSLAQIELARYVSDRGDAPRALRLLSDAGVPADDPEVLFLRSLRPDPAQVGRNDPCPCGSGRKFKQCHLLDTSLPIERRAVWLLHKVSTFLTRPPAEAKLVDLVATALEAFQAVNTDSLDDDAYMEVFLAFLDDEFLWSVAMVEGGGLVEFLDRRAELLPDDEVATAAPWCGESRRLWEVFDLERGATLSLRDTATGDEVVIVERLGSQRATIGQHFLSVVGAVGAEHQSLGSLVEIPPPLRDSARSLLARGPSAREVAHWYGAAFRGFPAFR